MYPILLDLDGNGLEITELSQSTVFMDAGGDGRDHRTAWAGAGDGVLFIDLEDLNNDGVREGDGKISNSHEYIFTEWAEGAKDDLDGLRRAFDSNGDGKLTAADARWGEFKVLVTEADGQLVAQTLGQLGIDEIDLTADATYQEFADGSAITGEASFVINGVTRTLANTRLMAEAQGYDVVETSSTLNGIRTVTQTAKDASGDVVFEYVSATSANGRDITNTYDYNGDGVVDQIQTIKTTGPANGTRTEMVINRQGADLATSVLLDRTETVTSANGAQVTIKRDTTGGGWFDEREVRTTNADGSQTVVISELARNGSVIRSVSETQTIDGMLRSSTDNLDGSTGNDRITTTTISENAAGERTELVTVEHDAVGVPTRSLEATDKLVISANGRIRTRTIDVDGDGLIDRRVCEETTLNADGSTSTEVRVSNRTNSLLVTETNSTVSADGLVRTSEQNLDGDIDFDRFVNDTTVIATNGSRTETITVTNADGSINSLTKTFLGADKKAHKEWVDLNQNGTFDATDLVRNVTVNATSGDMTDAVYDRAANGAILAREVSVTNSAGTNTVTTLDRDGDTDGNASFDLKTVTDIILNADGSSTEVVTATSTNGTQISRSETTTSADGLIKTTLLDVGGLNANEYRIEEAVSVATDGIVTATTERFAGNGTTRLSWQEKVTSADRLTTTVKTDADGDGNIDRVEISTEHQSGSKTNSDTSFYANGQERASLDETISANGLERTTSVDVNGDDVYDSITVDKTAFLAGGEIERTVTVKNDDGSKRSVTVVTEDVGDGRSETISKSDIDGDGTWESVSTATTTIQGNGTRQTVSVLTSENGALLSRSRSTVSDDGLVTTVGQDADHDYDYDLTTTTTVEILDDGSKRTTVETRDLAGARAASVTTISDDGREQTTYMNIDGDADNDFVRSLIVADDGVATLGSGLIART